MSKGCGCGGGKIAGFGADGMMEGALSVAAGYGGYYAGSYATEKIDFLQEEPVIDGGIKIATAVALPMFFPRFFNKMWKISALVGVGVQGTQRLIDGLDTAKTEGVGYPYDWDNYEPYRDNNTRTPDMV